ncbi:hypothetical protein KY290_020385 [Solanum tuberosum]|uniref:HMA domain-containing protein n=1 Tax=Solanum tuberosum TaxID=4113 RepID=A0ABQ7V0J9_SOLTU|nr:hypothetical protein KY290_020385 [Solanum tuberosum]
MGIVDHISDMFEITSTRKSKRKPMQTVEIKVKMDCDGCERKVTNAVSSIKGVKSVDVSRKQSKVTHAPTWVVVSVAGLFYPYLEVSDLSA